MNVIGEMFSGGKHSLEPLPARARGRFTRPILWGNLLVPCALVQGPDRLPDLRIANYQESPALHISATRRAHARLQDLSDQLVRYGVWLQPPHRPGGSDNLEQGGGVRGC